MGERKPGPNKDMKQNLFEGLKETGPKRLMSAQQEPEEFGMLIDFENPSSNQMQNTNLSEQSEKEVSGVDVYRQMQINN